MTLTRRLLCDGCGAAAAGDEPVDGWLEAQVRNPGNGLTHPASHYCPKCAEPRVAAWLPSVTRDGGELVVRRAPST